MYGKRWTDNDTLRFISKLRNKEYHPDMMKFFENVDMKGLEELEAEINERKLHKKELKRSKLTN